MEDLPAAAMTPTCPVLMVDACPSNRIITEAVLGMRFAVTAASTAQQARELLAQRPYSAVLADETLPDGTGISLLE